MATEPFPRNVLLRYQVIGVTAAGSHVADAGVCLRHDSRGPQFGVEDACWSS
jgi:hypothetical protein